MESYNAFAFETLTVPSANSTVTLSKIKYQPDSGGLPVRRALITVNPGPPLSYTIGGGVTASSATGHRLTAYSSLTLEGHSNIAGFQTTSMSSGTTGAISVTYFR